mmetsp:Transcript_65627/g.109034  ORF Transcript_65627/g.109034 Transcript_65627/m.109034 type:complete len:144 (-) Transcript_65627:978-1409(-)
MASECLAGIRLAIQSVFIEEWHLELNEHLNGTCELFVIASFHCCLFHLCSLRGSRPLLVHRQVRCWSTLRRTGCAVLFIPLSLLMLLVWHRRQIPLEHIASPIERSRAAPIVPKRMKSKFPPLVCCAIFANGSGIGDVNDSSS